MILNLQEAVDQATALEMAQLYSNNYNHKSNLYVNLMLSEPKLTKSDTPPVAVVPKPTCYHCGQQNIHMVTVLSHHL